MKNYEVVGYRKNKYGFEVYCSQVHETEEQEHKGRRVLVAFSKDEPTINEAVEPKYYAKTKKFYVFK